MKRLRKHVRKRDALDRITRCHKRAQVARLFTWLTARTTPAGRRPVRILSCLGMRAEESPARAKRKPFEQDQRNSNGKRIVDA